MTARLSLTSLVKFKPTERGWQEIQRMCIRLNRDLKLPHEPRFPRRDSRGYMEATFCEFTQWLGLYLPENDRDPVIDGDVILLEATP